MTFEQSRDLRALAVTPVVRASMTTLPAEAQKVPDTGTATKGRRMATITNFKCVRVEGQEVQCDAFGNNVALRCPGCGHPILAIARDNQRGSDGAHPAQCRSCLMRCWIEVDAAARTLRLHRLG